MQQSVGSTGSGTIPTRQSDAFSGPESELENIIRTLVLDGTKVPSQRNTVV